MLSPTNSPVHILKARKNQITCEIPPYTETSFQLSEHLEKTETIPHQDQSTSTGLHIELRGTAQLNSFPEAKAAFLRAAQRWEGHISTPVKVVIEVDFGTTRFGQPFPPNVLGSTFTQDLVARTGFGTIREALINEASPEEKMLILQLPLSIIPTDLGNTETVVGPSAVFRALNLLSRMADPAKETALGKPPSIGFNSAFAFDFNPTDGISPDLTDFEAVVAHEIGHILGFTSNVGYTELVPAQPSPTVWDLFRFKTPKPNSFTNDPRPQKSGGSQYFYDGNGLPVATGRPDGSGGDGQQASHWRDDVVNGTTIGLMDPTLPKGKHQTIDSTDLRVIDRIGWSLSSSNPGPDPSTNELKTDDGTPETGFQSPGLCVVNRLTPPSYPCQVQSLKFFFPRFSNQPSPIGRQVRLVGFFQNSNNPNPPEKPTLIIDQPYTISRENVFVEIPLFPLPPPILQGDLFVGYEILEPSEGMGFAVDVSQVPEERVFFSTNSALSFSGPLRLSSFGPINALLRAIISIPGETEEIELKVISPNGNESFVQNQPTSITWAINSRPDIEEFEIALLSKDLSETIATGIPPGVRSYEWNVAETTTGADFIVEVTAYLNDGSTVSDSSDSPFEITNSNSIPTQEELKYDSGKPERILFSSNLILANRFTPSGYPAKFISMRVFVSQAVGYPNPLGQSIKLIGFSTPGSQVTVPKNPPILFEKIVTISKINEFIDFPIDPITIQSGDVFLGYQTGQPVSGVGFTCQGETSSNRTYQSRNNGKSYRTPVKFSDGTNAQLLVRALCEYPNQTDPDQDYINPVVRIEAPSIPTQLPGGSTYQLRWNSSDNKGVVSQTVEFDGTSSIQIATGLPGTTQTFTWSVPKTELQLQGSIRIQAFDLAQNEGTGQSPLVTIIPQNPGGSQQEQPELLQIDDGTPDVAALADNLLVLNRLTPSRYPARLTKVQIYFAKLTNQPDPVGKKVQLRVYQNSSGTPNSLTLMTTQEITIPATGVFSTFSLSTTPTIQNGHFWVGYQSPTPHSGLGFATDTQGNQRELTFFSTDSTTFKILRFADGKLGTALIRAEVQIPK